ncbi:MAG: hypothetical protein EU547_05095 [Promethearchaeota archaeon]|nr:MAG: hypothetical protein EU547_05095 [Candidatus Lokiarchaeota archaeon]
MEFLTQEQRDRILQEWDISELSLENQIVKIFEKVRDIPFGRNKTNSRDPMDVYEFNKGTCSGKNFLLRELYKGIGLKTRDMICMQRWKDLTWFPTDKYKIVEFPEDLKLLLQDNEIIDFHNYVKVLVDGKWIQVDVTIDKPLTKLGFFTTEDWDGNSDMPLCFCGTDKIWDCGDEGPSKKKELIKKLPEGIVSARKEFLLKMTEWINKLRSNNKL